MGKNYLNWDRYKRPDAGADAALDAALDGLRDAYTNTLNDFLEKLVDQCPDAKTAQFVVQDFALFAAFLATVKMVELASGDVDRQQLLSAQDYLRTRMEREIPEQLIALAKAVAGDLTPPHGEDGTA